MHSVDFSASKVRLYSSLLSSVAEEMGATLERVSFSPNIKERRDCSCAVFNREGVLAAQAAHIPVHLGAMEFLMRKWLADGPPIDAGRAYITNDPYFAGTHLPDISVIMAVPGLGFVAARAHHSDIGGETPGSFSPVDDIRREGMLIEPQELTSSLIQRICERCRGPQERRSDLDAQVSAVRTGAVRLHAISAQLQCGFDEAVDQCVSYSRALTEQAINKLPAGTYSATERLEDIQCGNLCVSITITNDAMTLDFSGTDPQANIGINATEAVTRSACYYVVRCSTQDAPTNGGCWMPVNVIAPSGSLVNATYPAPVVAGNTETSQRIVDVILQALPGELPACSQGTMNNVAFGGDGWAYYETIAGGAGAGPNGPGVSGIHSHMTNTRNTPIEALQIDAPLRIEQYEIRRGSGGGGRHDGGDGVVRAYEALEDGITCSLMTERRKVGPPGRLGGRAGLPGRNVLVREGQETLLPAKGTALLLRGDIVRIETPGGGGWGE
ncbi:MAG: hydantoinase B/oxoprolinase family protein [Fimbriimonadales bacterium]